MCCGVLTLDYRGHFTTYAINYTPQWFQKKWWMSRCVQQWACINLSFRFCLHFLHINKLVMKQSNISMEEEGAGQRQSGASLAALWDKQAWSVPWLAEARWWLTGSRRAAVRKRIKLRGEDRSGVSQRNRLNMQGARLAGITRPSPAFLEY